jgi:hypothetical protein
MIITESEYKELELENDECLDKKIQIENDLHSLIDTIEDTLLQKEIRTKLEEFNTITELYSITSQNLEKYQIKGK